MFNPFSTMMSIWNGHPRIQVTGSNATAKAVTPASRTVNILNRRVPATHPAYCPSDFSSIAPSRIPLATTTITLSNAFRTTGIVPPSAWTTVSQKQSLNETFARTIWTDDIFSGLAVPPPLWPPAYPATATTTREGHCLEPATPSLLDAWLSNASSAQPAPRTDTFAFHLDASQIPEGYRDAKLEDCIDTVGTYKDVFDYPGIDPTTSPVFGIATCPIQVPKPRHFPSLSTMQALHEQVVQEHGILADAQGSQDAVCIENGEVVRPQRERGASSGNSSATYFMPDTTGKSWMPRRRESGSTNAWSLSGDGRDPAEDHRGMECTRRRGSRRLFMGGTTGKAVRGLM